MGRYSPIFFLTLLFTIGQFVLGLPLIAFIGLCIFFLLISGNIEINSSKIRLSIPLGRYEIAWDDVCTIETDTQRGALVFCGLNKRVAIAGPGWWAGNDKIAIIAFLNSETERRAIEIKHSQKVLYRLSKNSKLNHGYRDRDAHH